MERNNNILDSEQVKFKKIKDPIYIEPSAKINVTMTDEQLDDVVMLIKNNTSEQVENMREIHEIIENENNENKPLEAEVLNTIPNDPSSLLVADSNDYNKSDISLFDMDKDTIHNMIEEELTNSISSSAKDMFDMDDESIINILSIVREYKKDNKYPVYKNMNPKLQSMIRTIANNTTGTFVSVNNIAKQLIQSFIDEAEMDQSFIDLEKSLDEVLNMPSIVDMYTEHMEEVMNTKIPEMVNELRSINENEKADKLEQVKQSFDDAYDLHLLKEKYNSVTRIRKAVRRDYCTNVKRYCDDLNYANKKTKFIMNDANLLGHALYKVFIEDRLTDNTDITINDIEKFIILLCMSLEGLDREDLPQAAYIYYLIKNIIILQHTEESKTDFSIKLINNIKNIIYYIREEEAKFNEQHIRVQHKQKRSVRNKSKQI